MCVYSEHRIEGASGDGGGGEEEEVDGSRYASRFRRLKEKRG